jgi:hypothetical protein
MSESCSSSSRGQYSTTENFALVHRPATNKTDEDLHKSDDQEQPLKHQQSVNNCALRTRLGLGNWKCGRCTKEGTACPCGILKKNRDQIESLIASMVLLSQESPELISKVTRLAQLAHCQFHQRKDPQDVRKTEWMTAFPAQHSDVRYLEEQVRAVFGSASTKCGAAGPESNSCGRKIGGRKVQNFQRAIGEVMRLSIYLRDSQIDYYLGILEKNVYCSVHELTMPPRKHNYWKSKILEIRTVADLNVGVSAHYESPYEFECQALYSESTGYCSRFDSNDQQLSSLRALASSEIGKNSISLWPGEFDVTPFHIIRKGNGRINTPNDNIQRIIGQNLSKTHRSPGYIYVFQANNIEGYLKTGYTTSPVLERLQSLIFDCNRQMKVLFPVPPESAKMVPNAWRVEQLCHAELVDCQVHIDCTGCLCEHKEWFKISAEDAFPVVKKWSAWMDSTPYEPALGSLKEEERRKISDVNHFMRELSGVAE